MDRDGRVAQHRLRPRRGDRDVPRLASLRVDDRIVEVPEVPGHRLMKDLVVADGRLKRRVPVDQPLTAVDQAFLEETEERVAHGPRADRIEREAGPLPVAATAHLLELAEDAGFVGLLPPPDPLDEPRAAQLVPRELLLDQQAALDDGLGGDARVVGARHPKRLVALHPLLPDQNVLERVIEGVAQVECTGHVRWRDDDRVGLPVGTRLAVEVALLLPEGVPAPLGRAGIVLLRKFTRGGSGHDLTSLFP